jgi:hypothetical protein
MQATLHMCNSVESYTRTCSYILHNADYNNGNTNILLTFETPGHRHLKSVMMAILIVLVTTVLEFALIGHIYLSAHLKPDTTFDGAVCL